MVDAKLRITHTMAIACSLGVCLGPAAAAQPPEHQAALAEFGRLLDQQKTAFEHRFAP